jgi:hypothetical protein
MVKITYLTTDNFLGPKHKTSNDKEWRNGKQYKESEICKNTTGGSSNAAHRKNDYDSVKVDNKNLPLNTRDFKMDENMNSIGESVLNNDYHDDDGRYSAFYRQLESKLHELRRQQQIKSATLT